MEQINESLQELGYPGPKSDVIPTLGELQQIAYWLSCEIHGLADTEERLSAADVDVETFSIELSGFLKELNCPFESLVAGGGTIHSRLQDNANKTLLLEFLISELMSLRMAYCREPQNNGKVVITLQETPTASALNGIVEALNMGKPPANLSIGDLFNQINSRLDETLTKCGRERIGKPLLNFEKGLTDQQWADLEKRHTELEKEYDLRRQMLLTRLDCTIQAFNWSDRMKSKSNEILATYRRKQTELEQYVNGGANTDIAALLAARDLLLVIEKSSSAAVLRNTKSKIQRHIIGQVPDRGGRAWEHAAPPPEMPSWQKQRASGGGGGGFGGNRGGGRGEHRGGGRGEYRGGGRGGSRGGNNYQNNSFDNRQDNYNQGQAQQYDHNRGSGNRVQSGWSQRGNDRGGGYRGNSHGAGGDGGGGYHSGRGGQGNYRGRGRNY